MAMLRGVDLHMDMANGELTIRLPNGRNIAFAARAYVGDVLIALEQHAAQQGTAWHAGNTNPTLHIAFNGAGNTAPAVMTEGAACPQCGVWHPKAGGYTHCHYCKIPLPPAAPAPISSSGGVLTPATPARPAQHAANGGTMSSPVVATGNQSGEYSMPRPISEPQPTSCGWCGFTMGHAPACAFVPRDARES